MLEWTTESFTKDGFEMAFQSNYLTHWLLTVKLLQSMDKNKGRIVVLGSWSHELVHLYLVLLMQQSQYVVLGADTVTTLN